VVGQRSPALPAVRPSAPSVTGSRLLEDRSKDESLPIKALNRKRRFTAQLQDAHFQRLTGWLPNGNAVARKAD
jgi:hypothetical protein